MDGVWKEGREVRLKELAKQKVKDLNSLPNMPVNSSSTYVSPQILYSLRRDKYTEVITKYGKTF